MTEKLYYIDSHMKAFTATVTSCEKNGDRFEVTLDRFYDHCCNLIFIFIK